MAYSSGDTDKDDASQVARIMNFAIFIVRIFLRGNVTRQKRSNAIAVNFKIEHDTVESEMKLADLHTITSTTPSRQWYLPVICLVSLPGMLQTVIKISAAAMFMIRRYVIVLNRVFLFTVHISRRLPIMETKMITACPIMLMTFSTAGVLHFGFTRIVRHNSRDVPSIVSSVVHCTIPSFLRFQRYACLLWRENKG